MQRVRLVAPLVAVLAAAALMLTGCGGGTAADAASTAPATSASVASSASPQTDVVPSSNTVTYTSAVFEKMATVAIEPNCQSPTTFLSAEYSATDFSCSLTLDREALFSDVCSSSDPALIFTDDPKAGTCTMTATDSAAVKSGCEAIVGDATVSVAFDDATSSCVLTVDAPSIISEACDPAIVAPLDSRVDETGLTCTLRLTAPVAYQIIAEAVNSGDITCDDGSPLPSPSEACVLAALNMVGSKP